MMSPSFFFFFFCLTPHSLQDTAFWQKSFASEVRATVPAYNLAALAVFGIPWGLGTVIGLSARALHNTSSFPIYPHPVTSSMVETGMIMPLVIKMIIGTSGIGAFFVLLFMALTSTISSSMIAVSSILSFDLYKTYMNPRASDKRLLHVSHITVIFHACFITGISIAMNYGGANMTWIGYFRPILSCPGIIPLGLTLCWSRQTKLAATVAPVLGFFTGLGIWLGTAKSMYGAVNMTTTGEQYPALYGSIGSLFSPALYSVILSLYKPYRFDWREFLRIELIDEAQLQESTIEYERRHGHHLHDNDEKSNEDEQAPAKTQSPQSIETPVSKEIGAIQEGNVSTTTDTDTEEKKTENVTTEPASPSLSSPTESRASISLENVHHPFDEKTLKELYHWSKISWAFFVIIVLVTFVAWPMPLYRNYIFTKSFFSGWTTVAIIWQFFAFFAVVVYPLYDGRRAIIKGVTGVYGTLNRYLGNRKST